MSKITFLASGTRGDAQPAVVLGKRLQALGHHVTVVASHSFQAWIEREGLRAAPTTVDIQAIMLSETGHQWVEQGYKPWQQVALMRRLIKENGRQMVAEGWAACRDADVIISSFTSDAYALSFAEKTGAFHASMPLQPTLIATGFGPALPNAPLPGRYSRLNRWFSRFLIEPFPWQLFGDIVNDFRRDVLALPPQTNAENIAARRRLLMLHAYSQHVSPLAPDWPANFHITGFWFPADDAAWTPPPALTAFLAAGPPPVGFGFGSMTGRDPAKLTRLLVDAAQAAGQRALILSGWAGLGEMNLPDTVFTLPAAPHPWLLPRLAAFVHHGGAGTTAAALRAGVPTVIVPHFVDQPFWADRLYRLGVTPKPIWRHKLTAAKLAAALTATMGDATMAAARETLAAKIRAEAGVERALQLLIPHLSL